MALLGCLGQLPFVHPELAGAALATGLIPVLIHFLNRRRSVRVPWAAMSFLLAANRKSRSRIRFEHWLLMAARIAAIVFLGLAVARPFVPFSALTPLNTSRSHHVLILDDSLSMSTREAAGATRFQIALACVDRMLQSLPNTDSVSVITSSLPAKAFFSEAIHDRRLVRDALAAISNTQKASDTAGALRLALETVRKSESTPTNRFVYLVSDLSRREWSEANSHEPKAASIALRRVADELPEAANQLTIVQTAAEGAENAGIIRMETDSVWLGVGIPATLRVEVANTGARTIRGRSLEIRRGTQIVRKELLPTLEPGASTSVPITLEITNPGPQVFNARLSAPTADALSADDQRFLCVDVAQTTRILLVDGEPGSAPPGGQAGYLAVALANLNALRQVPSFQKDKIEDAGAALFATRIVDDAELAGDVLAETEVVALCNVSRLTQEQWQLLERFVRHGGGLLVFMGDLVSTENYNEFGYAGGTGLLPGQLGRTFVSDSRTDSRKDSPGEDLGFKLDPPLHRMVAEFAQLPSSGLFTARVFRHVPFEPDPNRAEVVMRYTNNEPAIVNTSFGKGRVVLVTTSANMDWTNLPARPDFVSLFILVVTHLAPPRDVHRNLPVGAVLQEPITAAQASMPLRITTPDGKSFEPAVVPEGEGLAVRFGPLEQAGVYRLSIGPEVREAAANIDAAEADPGVLSEADFRAGIDRPFRFIPLEQAQAAGPPSPRASEFPRAVFLIVIGLLIAEMALAARFGRQRG